ncbi:hypothetical protein Pyn_13853 [Prunus yedoensis var. nudiflora]|uniref:Hcy-binding domain-containing protein n=1 Tax=Prunus yedoensis var. nudiflora TaxID=2094558 RepID=A0A314YGU8_PRUYE|nr:hypothetical protein Pyn_13853 [Prunus yedoensis var. nudiflora]
MGELGWFFNVYIWRLQLFYKAICSNHQFWLPLFTDFLAFCLIKNPNLIKRVRLEYLGAGTDILVTSSYQGKAMD